MTEGQDHDFNEFLRDRDRVLIAAWTLPNEGTLTDAQREQALRNFDSYRRLRDISLADVVRQVGTPHESTIRELLKGTYRENADQHIRALNLWVEQHARQQAVKLKGRFVQTGIAMDILHVARLVRENQTMGLVVGPAGIGKTRCAEALHEAYVGSILLMIRSGAYSPRGFTSMLAEKLGVHRRLRRSDGAEPSQLERVIERLRGSGRLLIVDEAHKLTNEGLELLREIHDATQCPVFMPATKDLQERIQRTADPDHGQLYSRVDIMYPLTQGRDISSGGRALFMVEEIRKLYELTPIRLSPDAERYLQGVANELGCGSLRRCRILLLNAARRARKRAGLDDESIVTVTADDLAYVDERLRPQDTEVEVVKRRRAMAAVAKTG
jgi:DNA transposition AAA+ family ATPase